MNAAREIFETLRSVRQRLGISQWKLAEYMGDSAASQSWISELETGKVTDPPLSTIRHMAEALDLGMTIVFYDDQRAYPITVVERTPDDVVLHQDERRREEGDGGDVQAG